MKKYETPELYISEFEDLDVLVMSFAEKDKWDDGGFGDASGNF